MPLPAVHNNKLMKSASSRPGYSIPCRKLTYKRCSTILKIEVYLRIYAFFIVSEKHLATNIPRATIVGYASCAFSPSLYGKRKNNTEDFVSNMYAESTINTYTSHTWWQAGEVGKGGKKREERRWSQRKKLPQCVRREGQPEQSRRTSNQSDRNNTNKPSRGRPPEGIARLWVML